MDKCARLAGFDFQNLVDVEWFFAAGVSQQNAAALVAVLYVTALEVVDQFSKLSRLLIAWQLCNFAELGCKKVDVETQPF
jgi:hypothetical protein